MPTAASSVPLQSHRPNEQYMPNVPIREKLGAVLEFVEPPHDLDIMRMLPLITTESLILMTLLNRAFAAAQRAQKDPSLAGGVVETALQLKEELLRVRETMEKSNRLKKTVLDMMKTLSEETFQSVDALLAGMDPEQVISKLELVGSVQGALRALGLSEKCSIPAPISPRKDIKTRAKTTEKCTITFQTDGLGAASPLTFRESTCQELYSFMEHRPVVLVRAPPYSGKTSLGDVFEAYLHNKGWKVSVISLAGKADTPLDKFLSNSNMPIGKFFNIQEPFALIIDEAQKAYNEPESSFWCTVKAAKGSATRNRIILLASYGKVNAPKGSTPVDFMGCEKSAEFLSFREEEFIEYCHAMNTGNAGLFQLTDPVIRCIAQFTGLHVGLSTLIVFRLFHEFQDKVSDEKVMNYVYSG
ncbi:hypothetical protein Pelo_5264 [Pelomyxa schiedti]|nr:hypothetical protein Pelo_5264 [Pelomyxa schiedti]